MVAVSEILVMQMRGVGGPANPYIRVGEPVALQPGGQGRPPRCRAAGPQGPARNFLHTKMDKADLLLK